MRSVGAVWLGAFVLLTGCRPEAHRLAYESSHMGTPFRIVLFASDSLAAERAADAAFARVAALDAILSDYDPDSELSRLSDTAGQDTFVQVSGDLWTVLRRAQAISRETDGAFDVTTGPLTRLWRRAIRRNEIPDSAAIAQARAAVGNAFLDMDSTTTRPGTPGTPGTHGPPARRVHLRLPGMRLDLGGIAKGYAADAALVVLREHGFGRALVDAGGDIMAGDPPPGRDGWSIDLPDGTTTSLANRAVAVSGDTYRFVEANGVRYSHVIDPLTGYGTAHVPTVVRFADNAMTADARASAQLVLEARIMSHPSETTP